MLTTPTILSRRFYNLSASKAIFRARTYIGLQSYTLFSPVMMITWWMKLAGNLPLGHDALLVSISGTGSFICPVAQIRLDIPMPLITQYHRHGWTYQDLWLPSHTDTAGHTKAFDYPVTQTQLDIPRPLITQSHRHGWTYQGLWLPSRTDTAGHTKTFDYPVTQTRLDIPRPLITQSHRHGWTYQGLWLPSHTDMAGHTKVFDYPVTQTRLDIPRPLITQSHRHGWTYQGLWLPSHTDTAGHTKTFDYPVTQTRLDIPRPLITQSHRHGWTYQGLWLPSHTDTAGHTKAFDYPVTQTRLDIPRPLIYPAMDHWGESQSAPEQARFRTMLILAASCTAKQRFVPFEIVVFIILLFQFWLISWKLKNASCAIRITNISVDGRVSTRVYSQNNYIHLKTEWKPIMIFLTAGTPIFSRFPVKYKLLLRLGSRNPWDRNKPVLFSSPQQSLEAPHLKPIITCSEKGNTIMPQAYREKLSVFFKWHLSPNF